MAKLIVFFAAIVLFGAPCSGADKIYKWTDKNGKVHFGDISDSSVAPDSDPKKPATKGDARTTKPLDDQTWNRAVDRAENSPTGSGGRSIAGFAEPERPAPSYQNGGATYQYSRTYRPPGQAIQQADAERQYYQQQRERQLAQENQRKQLIAECERNRGTDCRDERTLRYMEDTNKPRAVYR